ncbi:MAG: TetR/AcrR family transcriptional regulator [Acidobacteriota bacterium]
MAKGENTRSEILSKALSIASKVGLEGLSIGGLAKAVGLSKSGLFAHFNSLERLQIEVLKTCQDRFIETVILPALRKPRGEPRIRALADNMLAWEKAVFLPGGCLFVSAANEFDDRPGPVRDFLVNSQKDCMAMIATAAKIAIEAEHFSPDLDTEQFAYEFYSIVLSYHHYARLLGDPSAENRYHRAINSLIERSRIENSR